MFSPKAFNCAEFSGSSTWARTRDLRINSPTRGAGKSKKGNEIFGVDARDRTYAERECWGYRPLMLKIHVFQGNAPPNADQMPTMARFGDVPGACWLESAGRGSPGATAECSRGTHSGPRCRRRGRGMGAAMARGLRGRGAQPGPQEGGQSGRACCPAPDPSRSASVLRSGRWSPIPASH